MEQARRVAEEAACWHCAHPVAREDDACGWCGVWLIDLDPAAVPPAVAHLLPLARRWGIGDDSYRSASVETASDAELDSMLNAMARAPDELWDLLADADLDSQTAEYHALTSLTMAYDEGRVRRRAAP